ncbi:MAG: hypothetical protein M1825_000234 [Sarcosagium campestre]|nr:MAG: hypothetical protein M1825_000234 [Sarcosagium campestre]
MEHQYFSPPIQEGNGGNVAAFELWPLLPGGLSQDFQELSSISIDDLYEPRDQMLGGTTTQNPDFLTPDADSGATSQQGLPHFTPTMTEARPAENDAYLQRFSGQYPISQGEQHQDWDWTTIGNERDNFDHSLLNTEMTTLTRWSSRNQSPVMTDAQSASPRSVVVETFQNDVIYAHGEESMLPLQCTAPYPMEQLSMQAGHHAVTGAISWNQRDLRIHEPWTTFRMERQRTPATYPVQVPFERASVSSPPESPIAPSNAGISTSKLLPLLYEYCPEHKTLSKMERSLQKRRTCQHCARQHEKCDRGSPCSNCSGLLRTWRFDCDTLPLVALVNVFLPAILRDPHRRENSAAWIARSVSRFSADEILVTLTWGHGPDLKLNMVEYTSREDRAYQTQWYEDQDTHQTRERPTPYLPLAFAPGANMENLKRCSEYYVDEFIDSVYLEQLPAVIFDKDDLQKQIVTLALRHCVSEETKLEKHLLRSIRKLFVISFVMTSVMIFKPGTVEDVVSRLSRTTVNEITPNLSSVLGQAQVKQTFALLRETVLTDVLDEIDKAEKRNKKHRKTSWAALVSTMIILLAVCEETQITVQLKGQHDARLGRDGAREEANRQSLSTERDGCVKLIEYFLEFTSADPQNPQFKFNPLGDPRDELTKGATNFLSLTGQKLVLGCQREMGLRDIIQTNRQQSPTFAGQEVRADVQAGIELDRRRRRSMTDVPPNRYEAENSSRLVSQFLMSFVDRQHHSG